MRFAHIPLTIAAIAIALTTIQVVLAWIRIRRRRPFVATGTIDFPPAGFTTARPIVSVLKPVCGLDDELFENLASFAELPDTSYEVILSVERSDDPALAVIERVRDAYPDAPFKLVVGEVFLPKANPKVERLIAATRHARGEILFISDSNVRIDPSDIAKTIALFDDPRIGLVSNPFVASGAKTLGAALESLHLLTFVLPGNVLADAAGVPCVVGKSMAIRREVLERIGGFGAFANVLAEDQAIALAVHATGSRLALAPIVVRNVVIHRTVSRALDRQIRWNKIRFSFSPLVYSTEFLVNPMPFAMLGDPMVAAIVAIARIAQTAVLSWITGARLPLTTIALTPLQDLLMFAGQFVPYHSNAVTWRGHPLRIGRGSRLLHEELAAA